MYDIVYDIVRDIVHGTGRQYVTCHLAAAGPSLQHPANSDSQDDLDRKIEMRDYQDPIAPLLPVSELRCLRQIVGLRPCGQRPC